MMEIFRYFSDLHGRNPDFKRETDRREICIIAGDNSNFGENGGTITDMLKEMCLRFKEVIYVPGNHDYYGTSLVRLLSKLKTKMIDHSNFTLLQGGQYVDRGDVRIIGATLWSEIAPEETFNVKELMNDYQFIRTGSIRNPYERKLTIHDTIMLHRAHVEAIRKAMVEWSEDTIVVTHHAPSMLSIDPKYASSNINSAFATELTLEKWPNYWIHGHIHRAQSYLHNGCNIVCNPGGYPTEYTGYEPLNNYFYL